MKQISYSEFEANPQEAMDKVRETNRPILIKRPDGEAVVLMSHRDFRSTEETMYLMQSPKNAARLNKSIAQLEAGRGTVREI